jgi:Zn-dependent membrane protease YugP
MRSALVPVLSFASRWSTLVIIGGIVLMEMGKQPFLFWTGIAMVAAAALFALITLPVEYNASARAMAWLGRSGTLQEKQLSQAREALNWAASTYLVAALSAIATLLYYLSFANRN